MSLRAEAIAAREAAEDQRATEARTRLATVLTPFDVATLTVEHTDSGPGWTLAVFTDGDVCLGVWLRGDNAEVQLVELGDDGEWTQLAPVESLAHLGELLPIHAPPPEPEPADPAWATAVAYAVGDRCTYDASTWECIQAHTSQAGWEPPNVPALWNRVA